MGGAKEYRRGSLDNPVVVLETSLLAGSLATVAKEIEDIVANRLDPPEGVKYATIRIIRNPPSVGDVCYRVQWYRDADGDTSGVSRTTAGEKTIQRKDLLHAVQ